MSLSTTLILGFIAGVTIVIGLRSGGSAGQYLGCAHSPYTTAVGVLMFRFWDVLSAAWNRSTPPPRPITALNPTGPATTLQPLTRSAALAPSSVGTPWY